MTEKSEPERLAEIIEMSRAMHVVVTLLNIMAEYLDSPDGSPKEDQLGMKLRDQIKASIKDGSMGSTVIGLLTLIRRTADPSRVQEFLSDASASLVQELTEIRQSIANKKGEQHD